MAACDVSTFPRLLKISSLVLLYLLVITIYSIHAEQQGTAEIPESLRTTYVQQDFAKRYNNEINNVNKQYGQANKRTIQTPANEVSETYAAPTTTTTSTTTSTSTTSSSSSPPSSPSSPSSQEFHTTVEKQVTAPTVSNDAAYLYYHQMPYSKNSANFRQAHPRGYAEEGAYLLKTGEFDDSALDDSAMNNQDELGVESSGFWPHWAAGYKDTAAVTPFSSMALNVNTRATENNGNCMNGFTKISLPLGPICIRDSEFAKECKPACQGSHSICWHGICVDPRTNMCYQIISNDGTISTLDDVQFISCKK